MKTASRGRGDRERSADLESHSERSVVRPLQKCTTQIRRSETRSDEEDALAASGLAQMEIDEVMVEEKLFAVVKQAAVSRLRSGRASGVA
jgi:hypothetical protein